MADSNPLVLRLFKMVIPLMNQHGIDPTPQNYHIWYEYISGQNKTLTKEIDGLINQGRPFTPELNDFLYRKFIGGDSDRKAVEEASEQAKKLMSDVVKLIDALGSGNTEYNKELDDFTTKLQTTAASGSFRPIVQSIVEKTKKIRDKGDNMNKQLAASNAEIKTLTHNLEKVKVESVRDFLTGAYNRKAFDETLNQLIIDARAQNTPLCVIMVDVDHFKKYNDTWGHQLGDEVLRVVVKTLTEGLRGSDIIARYGGEEFAMILPNTPLSGAIVVADKLRQNVASKSLRRKDTAALCGNVTVSMGAATLHPKDNADTIVARADEALYMAKKGGRNKVTQESFKPA